MSGKKKFAPLTPGPWKATVLDPKDPDWVYEITTDRADDPEGELVCTGGLRKANAMLIASAPDLLVAVKEAKAVLDGEHPDWADHHQPLFDQIEAALAKAEGRAP